MDGGSVIRISIVGERANIWRCAADGNSKLVAHGLSGGVAINERIMFEIVECCASDGFPVCRLRCPCRT